MKHQARKAVVKYAATTKKNSLPKVHRHLAGKNHRHVCTRATCRLTYEDNCDTPATNGRCHTCRGRHRPWVDPEHVTGLDPRPCCIDNTELIHEPDDLLRFECAGPGPWFQCRTCKRTHGHPCTDPDLIARPYAVATEGHA